MELSTINEKWAKNKTIDSASVVEFDRIVRRLEELEEEILQAPEQ